MASLFPTALPGAKTDYDNADNIASADQNAQAEDINALGAKVGIDSSATSTSHDYKLSGVTGTDKSVSKTGTETLTNKTLTTPTLTTPKVDTINEATAAAGVTIDGVKFKDSEPYCDVINEKTAATGVTVDGLLIKDSGPTGWDGWMIANETWTYASASTFTVAGVDVTTKYPKGTRLKWTQTTVKYGVVVASSFSTDTTITIAVNTDHTIADAAISANYYSYASCPQGYPGWFDYTAGYAWTAGADPSGAVSYDLAQFSIIGNMCTIQVSRVYATAGTTVTRCDIDAPVPINAAMAQMQGGMGQFSNAFAPLATYSQYATSTLVLFCASSTLDRVGINVSYRI